MSIIEIIGTTTIGIIIVAEFMAAIGIAVALHKIYSVTRTPQVPSYVNLSPAIESLLIRCLEQNTVRDYDDDDGFYDSDYYYADESKEGEH